MYLRWLALGIAAVLVAVLLPGPASASGTEGPGERGSSNDDAMTLDTGGNRENSPEDDAYERSAKLGAQSAEKNALVAELEPQVRALGKRRPGEVTTMTPGTRPMTYKIPASRDMTIHGQNKWYTCGPASLRNMVLSMNKTFTGTFQAKSEGTYESWLGTTTSGTAIGAISRVLNQNYSNFGSWELRNPKDKWTYQTLTMVDTYEYKQPIIHGVKAIHLHFWGGYDANHFNVVYGYNADPDTRRIFMQEVYDRVKVYGSPYPNGTNPYGHRRASLGKTFTANDVSCPNCSDRRRFIF